MRTLKFVADDLKLIKDESCDFSGLVPGTDGYLRLQVSFSPLWEGITKVAAFYSVMGKEYQPMALDKDGCCTIPAEALKNRAFKVQILGAAKGRVLKTSKIIVNQGGNI